MKWFVIVTNPNCERRAELELAALGYRTFVPKLKKWVSHARVRKAVERPLLGRYMFVQVDFPRQSFSHIRSTNGIETILSNMDGEPASVPEQFVEGFLHRYMRGEWDFVRTEPVTFLNGLGKMEIRNNPKYPIGARIKVVEGQFDDMLATITGRKGSKVDFKILGTNQYGRMHECSVRAA